MLRSTPLNSGWRFLAKRWLPLPKKLAFSPLEWLPAQVPGHVHLDLQQAGVIADPFLELSELGCQWVDEEDWCYELKFDFHPDAAFPRRVLRFEGLDTICRVLLNGEPVAHHDNMFTPLELDVSKRLLAGDNTLRVEFEAAARVGRMRRESYLKAEGLRSDLERFDERAFVRKAQYMFGWDWGPRLISAGIWRPVRLLEFRSRIIDVHVQQRHLKDGAVELSAKSEFEGEGTMMHALEVDGTQRFFRDGESLRLDTPELWWPKGMGAPYLYRLTSVLFEKEPAGEPSLDDALDVVGRKIGLRTVELVCNNDEQGQSFGFVVNGKALWAVGANWIPDHSFPSAVERERVNQQLRKASDMNMNMLRVWGGGLYESDDFYDFCDELGILVWQDFPFACNYAPDNDVAQQAMRIEAIVNVKRLRNRASLALWCGNNENRTMHESKWGNRYHHPPRYYGEKIWEGTLPQVLAEWDPTRPYVPTSPWSPAGSNERRTTKGSDSTEAQSAKPANDDDVGDQHNWDVWHGRGDWVYYSESRGRFISEFGFAAAPGRRAWNTALGARHDVDSLDVRHPVARWHDKTGKGYDTFIGYVALHYPEAKNLAEWSYFSQLNQRDAMRFALEHYRSNSFCQGALIWQLNDCWPVQSWAMLDSEGDYKAAAYELRRVFAPVLLSVHLTAKSARFVAVLDNARESVAGELEISLRRLADGKILEQQNATVQLAPGERKEVLVLDLSKVDRAATLLSASLLGTSTARLLCEPKDAQLSAPALNVRVLNDALVIESPAPFVDLLVWSDDRDLGLLDNFVTLSEPGRVQLRRAGGHDSVAITCLRARSLAGEHDVTLLD